MKRTVCVFCLLLVLFLLAGCAKTLPKGTTVQDPSGASQDGEVTGVHPPETMTCRIADGAGENTLILTDTNGGMYTLSTQNLEVYRGKTKLDPAELKDGMTVEISYTAILETWPARFHHVTLVDVLDEPVDDRFGLYLQVLEDLWATDSGLNHELTYLGFDLTGLTDLSTGEKAALTWIFAGAHDAEPLTGTYEELAQQGYINSDDLYWADGMLMTLSGSADQTFSATKWRSGTGAYFFFDCTAKQNKDGAWSYQIGGQAIS